jgi:hypothetical protein
MANESNIKENFSTGNGIRCPDILIQSGKELYLYNSKVAKVPGVNPVKFDNLEDYVEFTDWQRSQGIRCPVLYLQNTIDTQGNSVYKIRPSPVDLQGGLPSVSQTYQTPNEISSQINVTNSANVDKLWQQPNPTLLVDATHNDQPYNINSVPSFDQSSFYVGTTTPLEKMNEKEQGLLYSPNPMDDNWGGQKYTQSLVDSGYYSGDKVSIYLP